MEVLHEQSNIHQYSDICAKEVLLLAFDEMQLQKVVAQWSTDITQYAIRFADTCEKFTDKLYADCLHDGLEEYSKYYALVHLLEPWADQLSLKIIDEACEVYLQSTKIAENVLKSAKKELRSLAKLRKLENWANSQAIEIIDTGFTEYESRMEQNVISNSAYNRDAPSLSYELMPIDVEEVRTLYAEKFVEDLFTVIRNKKQISLTVSNCSKSSHCGSGESISSELMSPQSTAAETSGLHHFADKLLYSLSALENRSSESISSTDTNDSKSLIANDGYRRASAPELRVSSRKSSLKTVIEELPPVHSLGIRGFYTRHTPFLGRRLQSSEDRLCASMENIEDVSNHASYGELLAKEILYSAYKDAM